MAIFRLKRAFMGEIGEKCKCGTFWNMQQNIKRLALKLNVQEEPEKTDKDITLQ